MNSFIPSLSFPWLVIVGRPSTVLDSYKDPSEAVVYVIPLGSGTLSGPVQPVF